MEKINTIEKSIAALENALGLSITIVDNAGAFHTATGIAVFDMMRQSHKRNQACNIGFSDKRCRGHCRYAMNEKCAKYHEAFVETCWKGIAEIVIALHHDDIHYGMFYAGQWRRPELPLPDGLPKRFYAEYNKLPCLPPPEKIDELKSILMVFSSGILTLLKKQNAFSKVPGTRGNQIMEFIKNHAVEKIELSDVAEHLDLSCSRTSYIISDALNKTFPALLREERLLRVKTLLVSSNMTLNEIAVQTGFSDEYYLSRIFKRENGETPGQYKKRHTHVPRDVINFLTE